MKKILRSLTAIMLMAVVGCCMVSCGSDGDDNGTSNGNGTENGGGNSAGVSVTEQQVIGTWSYTHINTTYYDEDGNPHTIDMDLNGNQNMSSHFWDRLEMKADHTYVQYNLTNSEKSSGTWSLSGNKLYITEDSNGKKTENTITSISASQAIFRMVDESDVIYVTLTRVQ